MKYKRHIFLCILILIGFFLKPTYSYADIPNQYYDFELCNYGEKEVVCNYGRYDNINTCKPYLNDPSYYMRAARHLYGETRFCQKYSLQKTVQDIQFGNFFLLERFLVALFLTILIELIVASLFFSKWKKTMKLLKYVIFANLITLPIVWFIFPIFGLSGLLLTLLIVEGFPIIFEALFIYYFNKKIISIQQSFIVSIVMNIASASVGTILLSYIFH